MDILEADTSWRSWKEKNIKDTVPKVKKVLENHKKETISEKKLNFKNIIHKNEVTSAEIGKIFGYLWCFVNLSKDSKLREVARLAELELGKIMRTFAYDEELYTVFSEYYKIHKKEKLTEEEKKIVEDANIGYIKMGMHLDKKIKKTLIEKQNKISKLASEFDKLATENYSKGKFFKKEELLGVPPNILSNFKYDEKKKKYFVSIRPTEISNVLKYCEVDKTRHDLAELSANGVGDVNTKKFAEILKLRSEISKILGFKTFSNLSMVDEMVSKPEEAVKFLHDLVKQINPIFKQETKEDLLALKDFDKKYKKLNTWNWGFASNLAKEKELGVKEEEYKPYFELETCINVLFSIWKNIFGVNTEIVKDKIFFDDPARVYKFTDAISGELLGTGVFDLFPREGKYGHACMNDISKGYIDLEGKKHANLIYLICNFMQNKNGKTLLSFSDAITLFHEGGHFLHFMLMKNNYVSTSSVSNDFVEIPSQFHENFLLNEEFVKKNFKHYDTDGVMPKKLLQNITKMNKKGEASSWVTQSMYSLFDLELHGKNISKYFKNFKQLDKTYESYFAKYIGVEATKNRHFVSKFSHLTHGYESKYYSYVVSRVYAQDFWEQFSKGGIKKSLISKKYKKLLEAAGTKKEKELVDEFLGRKVSLKPFLKILKN